MNTPQQNVIIILLFIPMKYKKTAICKFKWNYLLLCRNAGTCKKEKTVVSLHLSLVFVSYFFLHEILLHKIQHQERIQ